jgi:hypothetical protein
MTPVETKSGPRAPSRGSQPFDHWLQKQLHDMYDSIAQEPLPDELLDLVTPANNPKS